MLSILSLADIGFQPLNHHDKICVRAGVPALGYVRGVISAGLFRSGSHVNWKWDLTWDTGHGTLGRAL
jgi:hypothetical protein